jgi:hypothetical protein
MQALAPLAAQAAQAAGLQLLLQPATANAASLVLGIVRPAYHTAAAADGPSTPAADAERRKWGRYWATLAACGLLEAAVMRMLSGGASSRPPPPPPSSTSQLSYPHARLALILWLTSPRTRGAARLYGALVRPAAAAVAPWVSAASADVGAALEKMGLATLADGVHVALTSIPGVCWLLGGGEAAPPPDGEGAEWTDRGGRGARAARAARKAVGGMLGAARRVVTGGGFTGGK